MYESKGFTAIMIITGNSNVDCFNRLGLQTDVEGEEVSAYWVGALQIEHFYQSIPIGEKVRSIFAAEKGWKFLSIGPHDIFQSLARRFTGPFDR